MGMVAGIILMVCGGVGAVVGGLIGIVLATLRSGREGGHPACDGGFLRALRCHLSIYSALIPFPLYSILHLVEIVPNHSLSSFSWV